MPKTMWDIFICHASEDKEAIARPLANALKQAGLHVWYDEFTLTLGDSLRRKIDHGLARSRYGAVILSPHFFAKEWPQRELDGLTTKEISKGKTILPIWHHVTRGEVEQYSPPLADKLGVSTGRGLKHVVQEVLRVAHARIPAETTPKRVAKSGMPSRRRTTPASNVTPTQRAVPKQAAKPRGRSASTGAVAPTPKAVSKEQTAKPRARKSPTSVIPPAQRSVSKQAAKPRARRAPAAGKAVEIPMPRIKKEFSQRERDRFIWDAFTFIKGYFKKALAALESYDSDVETDFIEATKLAYVCRIYVRGRTWKQCRIWLSGRMSSDQIYYYEGNVDIAGDSAFNEYISVEDDGYTVFLRLSNMGFSSPQQQETQVGKEKAAEDLWKRLTQSLKI
jgi:hypothetical protein